MHKLDPIAHWAIKDGDDYHELLRSPDGKSQYSCRKWSRVEQDEIQSRSTFTLTDRPKGDLARVGKSSHTPALDSYDKD